MMAGGLILSTLDGTESVYSAGAVSCNDCSAYSYRDVMSSVKDQGSTSRCVAFSVAQVVEWFYRTCGVSRPVFDIDDFYGRRSGVDGMSFKEAVLLLRGDGFRLNGRAESVVDGVMITSRRSMCEFVLGNGPVLLGLPVFDDSGVTSFWRGGSFKGYHAVVGVGYDSDGVELLNSWGGSYGDGGYAVLPWGEFNLVKECWGLLF